MKRTIFLHAACLVLVSLLALFVRVSGAAPSDSTDSSSSEMRLLEEAEAGIRDPLTGFHLYWKDGLHVDSRHKRVRLRFGGKFLLDAGKIDADSKLDSAFPDLDGYNLHLTRLTVAGWGLLWDLLELKLEIDFANTREIRDNWFRFIHRPFLRHFRFGYMKEPFSLEMQTSIVNRTFLDLALPTSALARGRNIGIRFDTTAFDERMTWSVGAFLNTSASGSLEEQKYQLKNPKGYDLTGRVTFLPRYENNGRDLMHLGLSYTHGFREEDDSGEKVQFRTRPETRLTDDRLVDTGKFSNGGFDIINPEFGVLRGPLSFQGEYFHAFTESKQEDDPIFWGYYVFLSYFLTGENRRYDPSKALFSELPLDRGFDFFKGGWGAWELGLRQSYVDLNDGDIKGGKELNFTLGLNWYLRRNMRMMFNYVWTRVKDRESPKVDDANASIFQLRFQLYF